MTRGSFASFAPTIPYISNMYSKPVNFQQHHSIALHQITSHTSFHFVSCLPCQLKIEGRLKRSVDFVFPASIVYDMVL